MKYIECWREKAEVVNLHSKNELNQEESQWVQLLQSLVLLQRYS